MPAKNLSGCLGNESQCLAISTRVDILSRSEWLEGFSQRDRRAVARYAEDLGAGVAGVYGGGMDENQLPDAELEVLACLWKHGQLTARSIRERMVGYRPMTHAAVSTLLKRLQDKGMVVREKGPVGKAFLYRAATGPRKTYRRIVDDLIERIFSGSGTALVTTLLEARPPSAGELEELQRLLDDYRKREEDGCGLP